MLLSPGISRDRGNPCKRHWTDGVGSGMHGHRGAVSDRVSGYPGMVTAGSGGSVTVTAKDSQGNTVTGYATSR